MLAGAESYDMAAFAHLQGRLRDLRPAMTMRTDEPRVLVVVSSITADLLPEHIYAVMPAYEERYLCYVLAAARSPNSRVIYVTSQPIPERVVDYYMSLLPGVAPDELRDKVTLISIGDWSHRPLSEKILERPRLLQRLRAVIGDTDRGLLLPFIVTEAEAALAVRLNIPIDGPDPRLGHLGGKSGSRRIFAAADVPHPRGVEDIRGRDSLVAALVQLQRERPVGEAIVKFDFLGGGLGNATVRLDGTSDADEIRRRVAQLTPEDDTLDSALFLANLKEGGVVEERLGGEEVRSPSVQLRISPMGQVEVLSTHDQLLGGASGQIFLGCTFPADPAYRQLITRHGRAVGAQLARHGVVGRFGVDFVTTRSGAGSWDAHAIEINLRNGGTTHPTVTLLGMTDGCYDEESGEYTAGGSTKHYVASDHLEDPAYRRLTPEDALDVLSKPPIAWNPVRRVGAVFHMMSAVAMAGRLGITAIGDSADEAQGIYDAARHALDEAAQA